MSSAFISRAKSFTAFSLAGFLQWPHDPEETEGYLLIDSAGVVDFYPAHIELSFVPSSVLSVASGSNRTLLGSFHTHPTGCTSSKCFYQPPSITDLNSVHSICDSVDLCEHVIVTKGRLFIIKFQRFPDIGRFTALMKSLEELKSKNLDPQIHEPSWFNIVEQYRDVVSVNTVPTPSR